MPENCESRTDADTTDSAAVIAALTTRVLTAWRKRLRRRGDTRPRSGTRGESERQLVTALLRVTAADDAQFLPALAAAAAQYSVEQPGARLDPGGLSGEFTALRQIVSKQLKERESPNSDASLARIVRLDQAISIVAKAAVSADYEPRGLHAETPSADHNITYGQS